MNLLLDFLHRLPQRDLRAIATRLGVRKAESNRKEAWVLAVHRHLLSPQTPARLLDLLSPSAVDALYRLLRVDTLPTPLFLAEYGPIRRAGVERSWTPPPWKQPASVSEELYYAGLLFPQAGKAVERSSAVAVPPDLSHHLLPQITTQRVVQTRPFPLLHDLAHVLFYLYQHPDLTLQHGKWLSITHVNALNQRLLQPDPAPSSHKRTGRLRFLFFLAQAARLIDGPEVTAFGWFWAGEPPAQQMTLLWQAWLGATTELRRSYAQPGSYLPAPWPHLLVKQLADLPMPCTPGQISAHILAATPAFQGFFLAYLEDISQLDELITATLAGPLAQLSLLFAQPDQEANGGEDGATARRFALTPTGDWLLRPSQSPLPAGLDAWPDAAASGQARLVFVGAGGEEEWVLSLEMTVPPHCLLPLAPFVDYVTLDRSGPTPCHRLSLSASRLARAAAQGHELAALFQALKGLGISLDPTQLAQLSAWHHQGRELVLRLLPVLRADKPESLRTVLGHAQAAKVIREVLTPTLAVVNLTLPDALARLEQAGFFARSHHSRADADTGSGDGTQIETDLAQMGADLDGTQKGSTESASNQRNQRSIQFDGGEDGDGGTIWLAGQVYALLARHLPLPAPPFRRLAALFATFSPVQQAGLTVQLDRIQADLESLLDGLVFTPPPTPTDPAQWQPILQEAVESQALLVMDYFVAGRNLLTHRTVQPHFIEERKGILYLRAYCHSAGQVLSFRLDRIQSLTPVNLTEANELERR